MWVSQLICPQWYCVVGSSTWSEALAEVVDEGNLIMLGTMETGSSGYRVGNGQLCSPRRRTIATGRWMQLWSRVYHAIHVDLRLPKEVVGGEATRGLGLWEKVQSVL